MLLIPMDMPKNCDRCPFFDDSTQLLTCNITLEFVVYPEKTQSQRMKDCPLVELEENRMYCLKDGVLYMSNAIIQRGKMVRIPAYVDFEVSEAAK